MAFPLLTRCLSVALLLGGLSVVGAAQLQPLRYNNPGLTVDLGVGLWAWPVPYDVDGDGDLDLIVSCPDKPSNGVWFFENPGTDTRIDPMPVFLPARKLSHTVHYVMPSYTDQGLRVLSPGLEYPDFLTDGLNTSRPVGVDPKFYQPIGDQPKGPKVRHNQWRLVDYDGDGALDLVVGIEDWSNYGWDDAWDASGQWTNGKLHGFVLLFRNEGSDQQSRYVDPVHVTAGGEVIDGFGCPSPNFVDFDNDGDLDLLCGEFLDGFTYYENIGSRTEPVYAAGIPLTASDGQRLAMELEMIVPVAFDWNQDGWADLIVGDEDGRVALVLHTGQFADDGSPIFDPPRYFQQVADALKSGALATPFAYDWDGDGDYDLLSGNTAGFIDYFENLSGPGVEHPTWAAPVRLQAGGEVFREMAGANGSIQGPAEAKWGYTAITVADWDHDGLPDILVNGIWGRVYWLKNIGTRQRPVLDAARWIEVQWPGETPKPAWTWWEPEGKQLVTQWRTTPVPVDWNDDGLVDLVMLDHEGYLAVFYRQRVGDQLVLLPPDRLFAGTNLSAAETAHRRNIGEPGLLQLNRGTAGASGRRKLCIVDWDGDGKRDILLNSSSANLLRQVAVRDGKWWFSDEGSVSQQNIQGHTTSPATVDFNGDGIPDLVTGAEDGRFYYLRNPR